MTEKISIVNAGDYQLFPGDSHDSMMVEDEFQPDGGERPPKPKRKRVSAPAAKKIRTELDSEVMDPDPLTLDEKVIHIDTRYSSDEVSCL